MAVKKTTSTSRAAAKIANAIKAEPAKAAKTAAKAVTVTNSYSALILAQSPLMFVYQL